MRVSINEKSAILRQQTERVLILKGSGKTLPLTSGHAGLDTSQH